MKVVKIFIKNECPRCPAAKELGNKLEKLRFYVQYCDLETVEGLAEAAMNQVMTTPTFIVEDESENIIQCWRGAVPNEHEIINVLR